MATTYRIPKFTDREIADALGRVRNALNGQIGLRVIAEVPHQGNIDVSEDQPGFREQKHLFDAESQIVQAFRLNADRGEALTIQRKPSEITDAATIPDQWQNVSAQKEPADFPKKFISFVAAVRKELQVSDAEAALKGESDSEWNRYRNAQAVVLSSLESAAATLMIKTGEHAAKLDAQRAERFEKLEASLRSELKNDRESLQKEIEAKQVEVETQRKSLLEREAEFNTKESHFVARQKQGEQIKQVQSWLENWALTKGTEKKRIPVLVAYALGILGSGWAAYYSIHHSYDILKSAADVAMLAWWQWLGLAGKAVLPLALCATFLVYFIRWASSWARQHSEEEFRNRSLLIDIGRSGWLLEAVRDAQVRQTELPDLLLKELSRNLFTFSANAEGDTHPQTVSDMVMQGLSKFRFKQGVDGTEVEAAREK